MVVRKRKTTKKVKRYNGGSLRSWFRKAGSWIKGAFKTVVKTAPKVFKFIKDKKILSTVLSSMGDPRLKAGGVVAGQLGFGKRRYGRGLTSSGNGLKMTGNGKRF